jgi:MFS transporter, DHA3 family, tetracycline resistance protein
MALVIRLPAYPVYLIMSACGALFFSIFATVSSVYRIQEAGLNPFQLLLVGLVLELSVFLFEIPTGVVADVYSRRRSVIIGTFLIGLGFMLEGAFPILVTILAAQAVWGIGSTFTSGAEQAWIADEMGEQGIGRVYMRGAQAGQIGTLIGIGASVAIASIQLNLALITGGALFVLLGVFLVMVMPENNFRRVPASERSSWQSMGDSLRGGLGAVRGSPVLITLLIVYAIWGAASEGLDRLWEAHLLANFTFPSLGDLDMIVWFGIINAVAMLLSLGATEVVRRTVDTDSHIAAAKALLAINILMSISVLVFALAGNFMLALAAFWATATLRRVNEPIYAAWLNQNLTPRIRATVFSMAGQADSFGQIAFGPVIGIVATLASLRAAMVVVAVIALPQAWLYLYTLRRKPIVVRDEREDA